MSHRYECSLILASHGSEATADSNAPMFELASKIESSGLFSAVTPAFLHGEPNMTNVFDGLTPGDAIIVPVMTSEGYYLNEVIPKKLQENATIGDFRMFVTPVAGMHPSVASLVLNRIDSILSLYQLSETETTVVIVGHGTRRNPNSGTSTYQLVETLRSQLANLPVEIAFLDQDPEAVVVAKQIPTRHTVIIPFLISRGPHTTVDIPEAFDLPGGPDVHFPIVKNSNGGVTVCDLPIGMYPQMAELITEIACDQLLAGTPS